MQVDRKALRVEGLHGDAEASDRAYWRACTPMDIWIAIAPDNAAKLVELFQRFGMEDPKLTPALFEERGKIVRMGVPPMRIEVLNVISRGHLRINKRASGRHKDLDDLERLPED